MSNPEEWIKMISAPDVKPFDTNPIIYPATWVPLRLLQMYAVAKVSLFRSRHYGHFYRTHFVLFRRRLQNLMNIYGALQT